MRAGMRRPISQRVTSPKQAAVAAPSPTRLRRVLLVLLAVLVLLGAGYAALLWWIGGQMRLALDDWAAQRRAQGWVVEYATPAQALDPMAATLRLPAVRLESGGLGWRAESVMASVSPFAPQRLRLRAVGAQSLALGGAPMPLTATALRGEVALSGGRDALLVADGAELATPAGPLRLEGGQVEFDLGGQPGTAALSGRLRGLVLPAAPPLGPRLEEVTLQARLHGLPDGAGPAAAQAARWRDAGGRLEVMGLTLRWGPMAASAAATLALDTALQPGGAGTVRIANPAALLDALGEANAVPARNLSMARRVLPLMTRPDAGGTPVVELPVTLEDRTLGIMRLPLLRLEAVAW
jgi:hypothetical protein